MDFLAPEQLTIMESQIEATPQPCIIVMHHPPFKLNCWLTDKALINYNEFNTIIYRHPNVKLVLSGHIHHHSVIWKNGVAFSSASSVGFAFKSSLPRFTIENGMEGFSLIDIKNKGIQIKPILL